MTKTQKLMVGAATAALALGSAAPGFAAEKWDMPMAYSASNFHSENGVTFADCVAAGTNSEITIEVHAGGSLFASSRNVPLLTKYPDAVVFCADVSCRVRVPVIDTS